MAKLKYITYNISLLEDTFIVFPISQSHSNIAYLMEIPRDKIIGAGFITFSEKIQCWGNSVSLGVKSNNNDVRLINNLYSLGV